MSLVTHTSPPAEKIALFRTLFCGRTDVYARRFESRKTGRAGYQPACGNEWVRALCEKPRIKCSDCPNQRWLPVTDDTLRWHLEGEDGGGKHFVMGIYPMLRDETCHFLAVDFDGEHWRADAAAFVGTCRELRLPVALERSRSGQGGHAWLFFAEALPAALARRLGTHVLTEARERRPDIGFRSYDRLFPNQDTLPKGGFGNLIALPLQKQARASGNAVFLDERFEPWPDQWAFLSSMGKLDRSQVEVTVAAAEKRGRILDVRLLSAEDDTDQPWTLSPSRRRPDPPITGPLPDTVEMVLGDQIYLANDALPPALRNRLLRLAAFQNPEFYRAQAMRLPVYDKPRIICCAELLSGHVALPRGCLDGVRAELAARSIRAVLRDERCGGVPFVASFQGELRPDQQVAAKAMLAHDTGVLAATTAFGKTVLAAWLIAQRGVNCLVLVHRQQLLEQWIERLSAFLNLPAKSIGRLGGGRRKLTGALDVALIQSFVRKGVVDDRLAHYGHLIVDECHHVPAHGFELVARRAKARYVTGLSATVVRKDGHHPIIFMQCGPVRHRVDAREQAAARPFSHEVLVRPTGFRAPGEPETDSRVEFQRLLHALVADDNRNRLICADVIKAVRAGRFPLVLTERTEHLQTLAAKLAAEVREVVTLQGGMGRKALCGALERLTGASGATGRVVVATGRFVGEGFDDARLDTLFLALPVSWQGTIAQYAGRLHRLYETKRSVQIYDYPDLDVPMLARMFDRRCRGYEAIGYSILLPASAVPGWPPEVPLPVDPVWKRDYAASVQRLIRDGIDGPLANLFVHAAREVTAGAEGEERARSATEAFLYRRLEGLAGTSGRFRMNMCLPIPFDQNGRMEVDLLCVESGLAIEIDGAQHLADADAYRRDRAKDAALQHHGYFVLRFLAEDVGRRLDHVLDTILAALARRLRR